MTREKFIFLDPGKLIDDDLELVLVERKPGDPEKEFVPGYKFEMRLKGKNTKVGQIDLRIGNIDKIVKYGGHIGYGVDEMYRGHRYATRSLRLLFPLAVKHGLDPLWVTCNPENMASRRTCEIAGGRLVEIIDLPPDNDMYKEGEQRKCRYRFDL